VFTKNKIHTLVDVVIVDLMRAYLLLQSYTTQRFTTSNVAQVKKKNYNNQHPHQSIFPSSNWNIWMFTQISWCVLTQLCQCYLEPKKAKGPCPLCLGYFSSTKNFNYIANDASILHLKSGSNSRPNYFSTSSRHTPIAMVDLLQAIGCWDGEFLTSNLC
jgi:hypothetical protein